MPLKRTKYTLCAGLLRWPSTSARDCLTSVNASAGTSHHKLPPSRCACSSTTSWGMSSGMSHMRPSGGLFREITQSSVELTVTEKIWGIIIDLLNVIADAFSFDQEEMMRAVINNNNKELRAVRRAFEALQLVA